MARQTSTEVAQKYAQRLKSSTAQITAGVDRVSESPTAKAAAKKTKMQQKLNDAINSGKWESGLRSVTLEDWKAAMKDKGVQRIAQGADAAVPKVEAFMSRLLPFQDALKGQIKNMPDVTLEDNINRMNAWTRGMSKFKKS